MLKRLFVLRIDNYWPELCAFTIPTIKAWCQKNGWEYNEITERHHNPIASATFSKTKIYELGADSDWNIICDADLMLRPDFFDPTTFCDQYIIRSSYSFKASTRFPICKYFLRNNRNVGISGGFVLTSKLTHDLWKADELSDEMIKSHLADEWIISRNLAKYGLHYDGISNDPDKYIVHFGGTLGHTTHEEKTVAVEKAKELFHSWSLIWPFIANQSPEGNSSKSCHLELVPK